MATGTFFQIMIAKTTSIASATQPPGFRPRNVGSASAMHFRLHRGGGFLAVHLDAGQSLDDLAGRFRRSILNLGAGRRKRLPDLRCWGFNLQLPLVRRPPDLLLRIRRALLLGLLSESSRVGACRVHA